VKRSYERPATPCDRLLCHPTLDEAVKETLRQQRVQLDPVALLHRIRKDQSMLAALASPGPTIPGPGRETLNEFLSQLPRLWQSGEVRPTHRTPPSKPRYWRTHKNPFASVWYEVLGWLQSHPEATAKSLFERLQQKYPGQFAPGQLRTLQRRIRQWREVMAKKLVYACTEDNPPETVVQS